MKAADTSLVVAAFASWDEQHAAARRVLDAGVRLIDQCALETYSGLTQLPPPHRSQAGLYPPKTCTRFRKKSVTATLPDRLTAIAHGPVNWPGSPPKVPNWARKFPARSKTWTR